MKRAYLANGMLVSVAGIRDNILGVDDVTWQYIENLLDGDYCYLVIGNIEVIKVLGTESPNILLVQRGIEQSCRRVWPASTNITYGLTESEISDAVTVVGNSISVSGALTEVEGTIAYTDIAIEGIGGCIVNGDDEGVWMVQSFIGAAGCCSIEGEEPPPIPLPYFNLRAVTEGYYRLTLDGNYRAYI